MHFTRTVLVAMAMILVCALAPTAASGETIIYVNAAAPAGGAGQSWSTACATLQDGLVAAASAVAQSPTVEIWVAAGTYTPDRGGGQVAGNRSATFTLLPNVGIFGGFIGNESARSQRDWHTNLSILSGDLAGDDLPLTQPGFGNNSDNSFRVGTAYSVNAQTNIDGCVISGGNNTRAGPCDDEISGGGGMATDGRCAIRNCTFYRNRANFGGGLLCAYCSTVPTIELWNV